MNVLRCVLSLSAALAVAIAFVLQAANCSAVVVLAPLALVGTGYGLWSAFELIFAIVVTVNLKARLRDQFQLREQVRSQRLRKARR